MSDKPAEKSGIDSGSSSLPTGASVSGASGKATGAPPSPASVYSLSVALPSALPKSAAPVGHKDPPSLVSKPPTAESTQSSGASYDMFPPPVPLSKKTSKSTKSQSGALPLPTAVKVEATPVKPKSVGGSNRSSMSLPLPKMTVPSAPKTPPPPPPAKREPSKAKWSGERATSSTNVSGGADESSTSSLLYKAPNAQGSTTPQRTAPPRPTLSVTGTKKPSRSQLSSRGGGSASAGTSSTSSNKPTSSAVGSGGTSSSKPTNAAGAKGGDSKAGGGAGNEFGLPVPDLSHLPGGQMLEDLVKCVMNQLDHLNDSSYWGVHLLTIAAVVGLGVYKNKQ